MSALSRENKDFRPRSMLDFGTGVGTALWAAQDIFGQMDEVFAVEPSAPMNDVARTVATKRRMTKLDSGSFFRLRLPADNEVRSRLWRRRRHMKFVSNEDFVNRCSCNTTS